jgi:hypothetical protein
MSFLNKAADLVNHLGRPFQKEKITDTRPHPLDDPEVWADEPMFQPPADINIESEQKWIDSMMGVTRDNQSIYKLVWNGDRRYWHQFFMHWNALGKPTAPPMERPRIRYKVIRDPDTRRPVRDVFPPRWLILTRIEPEQYADTWKKESYIIAPELCDYSTYTDPTTGRDVNEPRVVYKQVRPDEPPPVFWQWYGTVASHSDFCCATRARDKEKCFGRYASPGQFRETLELQAQADRAVGTRHVFEKVDSSTMGEIEDQQNGYAYEVMQLQAEAEIYIENPLALIGVIGSLKAEVNPQQAQKIVKEFYDREIQKAAAKGANLGEI